MNCGINYQLINSWGVTETEGEGSFQMHNLSNDVRCIYRILVSLILPLLSLTMITMERAHCLYAILTETPINYGFLVTSTMMLVRLADWGTALPYGVLITQIVKYAGVSTSGMKEILPEKAPEIGQKTRWKQLNKLTLK